MLALLQVVMKPCVSAAEGTLSLEFFLCGLSFGVRTCSSSQHQSICVPVFLQAGLPHVPCAS